MTDKQAQLLNSDKFARVAHLFAIACSASRYHSEIAQRALHNYGSHGSQISGCVRDHFPNHIKDDLRSAARRVTEYCEQAHAARPKYVRAATVTMIGRLVATRDGSGFYGPQPLRG